MAPSSTRLPATVSHCRVPRLLPVLCALMGSLLLGGCDYLGLESATDIAARKEAEGKAIGAGCRHAARSVEQCYSNNRRADKASVFAGWKEMNDYMRENNIEAVPPPSDPVVADAAEAAADDVPRVKPVEKAAEKRADPPAEKAGDKGGAPPVARPSPRSTEKAGPGKPAVD